VAVNDDNNIVRLAALQDAGGVAPADEELAYAVQCSLEDFFCYMPMRNYIYAPTRDAWPAASVDARVAPVLGPNGKSIKPSIWLAENRAVEQMTWAPGEPMLVRDRLIADGGWIKRPGNVCFNLYRPPILVPGDASLADPWLAHVDRVYPSDADHLIKWLAHRVQRPQEKINHALVLGGKPGIGKDTLLEPVKHAVGPWNVSEVSPQHMLGRFNGFLKSVILRVSEARDLGNIDRFKFYDHMKAYIAAPPDVLRVDEKHLREYPVPNCCGVVLTSNHKTDGLFLPADDRRHYFAWSDLAKESFPDGYWIRLWRWYDAGGDRHVAAYLTELDISGFDPKAPPPKTVAFWAIVDANRAPEDAELADVLDDLGTPDAVTIRTIADKAQGDFAEWLRDRKNRRVIPYRMERCNYVPVRNKDADDGLWKIRDKRQAVYARDALTLAERIRAARKLTNSS
jgi:hypothetical protein